jgi:hypothetical protein
VSATILGSALLGSTLLGSNSQGQTVTHSPLHESGGPTSSQGGSTNRPSPHQGSGSKHTMAGTNIPTPLQMPYLASLNILDLTKLTNDPILHDATWPAMPTKLPSDIPCWVCVIFFAQVVVSKHLRRACGGVRGGAARPPLRGCRGAGPPCGVRG